MFKKYTSIENSYRTEFLDRIKSHGYWDCSYIVQEKVHGSNLSYYTSDGKTFSSGKRNEKLNTDDKFYNHQLLLQKHVDKFRMIYSDIKEKFDNISLLTIYGEVIGGSYPHKEVQRHTNAIKVQKGIFYSPNNEFYAFDIQVNGERYLNVDYVTKLFQKYDLLHARTLFKGSLDDCLAHPNLFPTTVPILLGYPSIEPNNCEGVIIKSLDFCVFKNGVRVILKNKNEKWAENSKLIKTISPKAPLSEKVKELQLAIKTYVTENRLNNVLSKLGEVSTRDFGKIIGDLNRDVITDFAKDYKSQYDPLKKKEQKQITKSIVLLSAKLIKEYFKNSENEL